MSINERIYKSESSTADRNRSLAYFMHGTGALSQNVEDTLNLYFKLCSIEANTDDMSAIGATLANGGLNPVTGERVVSLDTACALVGLMSTCGLYNESGAFAVHVGIPGKSGVSGGIVCSVPGRLGIAVFSPPLDEKGNSVAGMKALSFISKTLKLRGM
jgi:glutaminase